MRTILLLLSLTSAIYAAGFPFGLPFPIPDPASVMNSAVAIATDAGDAAAAAGSGAMAVINKYSPVPSLKPKNSPSPAKNKTST
ncbi:hypothetical protein evm_005615 [Chilo suppressalis]|nr:hypothetical protein evm_005615 [Chilo suppressalis]